MNKKIKKKVSQGLRKFMEARKMLIHTYFVINCTYFQDKLPFELSNNIILKTR